MNKNMPASRVPSLAAPLAHRDIITAYARWAPVYDIVFGAIMAWGRRAAVNAIPARARDVIELGVGTGMSLPYYSPRTRVTAVDLSPDMLSCARRRVAAHRLTNIAAILEMDNCALEFDDDSFDAAVAMYVVTCVPDPQRMLDEAHRVVRPGGRVVIVSRFAAERGPRAAFGRALTPVGQQLGFNTTVTIGSLADRPELPLRSNRPAGLAGYYRLLEFEVVK